MFGECGGDASSSAGLSLRVSRFALLQMPQGDRDSQRSEDADEREEESA
jgi:hypothetical protein